MFMPNKILWHSTKFILQQISTLMIITSMPFTRDQRCISLVCSFQILSNSDDTILSISSLKRSLAINSFASERPVIIQATIITLRAEPSKRKQWELCELLGAGGQPSTWLPPGKLAEHPQPSYDLLWSSLCSLNRLNLPKLSFFMKIVNHDLGHSLLEREGVRSTLLQVTEKINVDGIIKKSWFFKIIKDHPRSSRMIPNAS